MRRWWILLALTAAVGVAGCGSSPVVILDTERVERAIEQSIHAQRKLGATVSCPSGVHQGKGLDFVCTANVRGRNYPVAVTQTDGLGHVTYVVK
jgi:hypothetical protein